MRVPRPVYRIQRRLARALPLSPSQIRWLAYWVSGTLLARSACQSAVVAALARHARPDALRQYLREGLYDGAERAAPCATQLTVQTCFGPLLALATGLWRARRGARARRHDPRRRAHGAVRERAARLQRGPGRLGGAAGQSSRSLRAAHRRPV